jgi:hypothetical protein
MMLPLIRVGYGSGRRGGGRPHSYFDWRRRAATLGLSGVKRSLSTIPTQPDPGKWGWVADVLWLMLVIAAIWLLITIVFW